MALPLEEDEDGEIGDKGDGIGVVCANITKVLTGVMAGNIIPKPNRPVKIILVLNFRSDNILIMISL